MPADNQTTKPATVAAQIASRGYSDKPGRVPEAVARAAYEVYHHMHSSQSFERLHERGGFGVGELVAFLYARSFPKAEWRDRVDEAFAGLVSR